MDIMLMLFCLAGLVALIALLALFWTIKNGQYSDPEGDAARILFEDDEKPPKTQPK
jgi:cbb3-type cytochrome oxidase maturation protein